MSHICLRRLPAIDARWVHYPMGRHHIGNSPQGLAKAKRTGRAWEVDLCLTRDGVPVGIHSNRFRRDGFKWITTAKGRRRHKFSANAKISDLSWATVSRLRTRDGHRIYRARNLFDRAARAKVRTFVHVKPDRRFGEPEVWGRLRRQWIGSGAHLHIIGESRSRFIYPTLMQAHVTGGFETVLLARGMVRLRMSAIPAWARKYVVWVKSARWSTAAGVVVDEGPRDGAIPDEVPFPLP